MWVLLLYIINELCPGQEKEKLTLGNTWHVFFLAIFTFEPLHGNITQPWQKIWFYSLGNWPGSCWRCIHKLIVCHDSTERCFLRNKLSCDWLWLMLAPNITTAAAMLVPSDFTQFSRKPQVTKILNVSSRPLQTAHLTTLNAAHLVSRKQDPAVAFKWVLKGYKLHPQCSQRALGCAQAALAKLCVSQQMPLSKKKMQTSNQTSLYKSTSRKLDSLRILWTLINQTDTDLVQWK